MTIPPQLRHHQNKWDISTHAPLFPYFGQRPSLVNMKKWLIRDQTARGWTLFTLRNN